MTPKLLNRFIKAENVHPEFTDLDYESPVNVVNYVHTICVNGRGITLLQSSKIEGYMKS